MDPNHDISSLPDGNVAQANVVYYLKELRQRGVDPLKEDCVIDCDSSPNWSQALVDCSPCLTHSRPQGHWLTSQARRLSAGEVFRLQGLSWPRRSKESPNVLRAMAGNAMSVPVLQAIVSAMMSCTSGFEVFPLSQATGMLSVSKTSRSFAMALCSQLDIAQIVLPKKEVKSIHAALFFIYGRPPPNSRQLSTPCLG